MIYDLARTFHIFTIPANKSSAVVHVTYKALEEAPYIDAESGLLVATHGFPSPVAQPGKITQFFGLRGSNITIGPPAYGGKSALSISCSVLSATSISFRRYCGTDIVVDISKSATQIVTLPPSSEPAILGDKDELTNNVAISFQLTAVDSLVLGDIILFQALPGTICPPQAVHPNVQVSAESSGVFTNPDDLNANIKTTFANGASFTLQVEWRKVDADPNSAPIATQHTPLYTLKSSGATTIQLDYGVELKFPPLSSHQSSADHTSTSPKQDDVWIITARAPLFSVESLSQPPAACFADDSHTTAYIAVATYHGDGCVMFVFSPACSYSLQLIVAQVHESCTNRRSQSSSSN